MRLIKRLAGWLGFGNHEVNKHNEDEMDGNNDNNNNNRNSTDEERPPYVDTNLHRKGFSVQLQVPGDKPRQIGPVLVPCPAGDGGIQGLQWYTQLLKLDKHGDVADEFLEEVFPETVSNTEEPHQNTGSTFQVKLTTKPANARNPCLSSTGSVQHYVKYKGRLQLM